MKALLIRGPLSLRAKLTLSFLGLALLTITGVGSALTVLNNQQAVQALRDKATMYARLLAPQLRPVVAFDDELTAREVFESFAVDSDVAGLAVYSERGDPIAGHGRFPDRLAAAAQTNAASGRVIILAPVVSTEGPRGQLYVSLATAAMERYRSRSTLMALGVGVTVLCVALLIASRLARPVARRISRIADAAGRVAEGDLDQLEIEPGTADEIGHLTRAFNVMVSQLRRQFVEREQLAATEQARLESLVTARTAELAESEEQYRLVAESTNAIPFTYDPAGQCFMYVGPQAERRLHHPVSEWTERGFLDTLLPPAEAASVRGRFDAVNIGHDLEFECVAMTPDGRSVPLRWVVACGESNGKRCVRGLILDISEQRRLERDLAQAQKLESVGRLAAGVAHEINTPVQFVNDSVQFVRDGLQEIEPLLQRYRALLKSVLDGRPCADEAAATAQAETDADLDYLVENMPGSLARATDGLDRIATIVRSMKAFAHPDTKEMSAVDINEAILSTLTIARNEYKYVADVVTELQPLPPVTCHAGEINQAVLNIVVNAAHAIGNNVAGTDKRGRIDVRSRQEAADVIISISDSGGGVPDAVRERIFDPFFTTKEVGEGTGQGLAIARSVIVDKHGGDLSFETWMGKGTTFIIRLPLGGPSGSRAGAAA